MTSGAALLLPGVMPVIGTGGTAQVGYEAVALERPVLAIGSFDGSAKELWPQLDPFYEQLGSLHDKVGNLNEDWQNENAEIVVQTLRELVRRRIFRRTRSTGAVVSFFLSALLFTAWVGLFVAPPQPWQATFFASLAVSAFLGTSLRRALRGVLDPTASQSREVAIAELNAGLLLAFTLSLLYLGGSFTFTGQVLAISDSSSLADYQRVAVAMGLIGIAGAWLLEQVAEALTRFFGDRLSEVR